MNRLRIAFLASNNGTSFRAVYEAIQSDKLDATAVLLVTNKNHSPAFAFAEEHGVPSFHIPTKGVEADADKRLQETLVGYGADLVVLSGYLRKLGPLTLETFKGRILNVHPGLLPKYGGLGMYGRKVHQAVLDNKERSTAATIHLVDAQYDHGLTIATEVVPIDAADDISSLEIRVMEAECVLFVETIRRIIGGQLPLPF
ncbi:phosphoribosylglycinamide formyltransferase [Rhizobium leguminosarum]|uniref:phosphoribosylglycinamide formyltransferase 1 n=1 Tax=Rhizobium leguminosarum TaxID=384 RepID=A0A7M3E3K9_RHILE|nr:phosphoribosylglycinamide formyltransferase [Rhizobium leguminosarum]TAY55527.1 phosphoribosylglycinamide formyltransferase [Rhizobium leguminosarum]